MRRRPQSVAFHFLNFSMSQSPQEFSPEAAAAMALATTELEYRVELLNR